MIGNSLGERVRVRGPEATSSRVASLGISGVSKQPTKDKALRLQRRRQLRRRSTKPEQLLWAVLRKRRLGGLKFRRQHFVGPFIVDFYCNEKELVIELDGDYHVDVENADKRRQQYLENKGLTVIRFSNAAVLEDVDAVAVAISKLIGLPPNPLPHRVAGHAHRHVGKRTAATRRGRGD